MLSAADGNMEKLVVLVEQRDVDLNSRDQWDATPLYYACLCGHQEVVQYLIEQGARCESNTFDGERCLYAALTPAIKQLLKDANLINSKTMRRDSFEEFLRHLMESAAAKQDSSLADIEFNIRGERVCAHKCLLFARNNFFAKKLFHEWNGKAKVRLNNARLVSMAFKAFIHYLYMGSMDVSVEDSADFISLMKRVGDDEMVAQIRDRIKKAENYKKLKPGSNFGQLVTVAMPDATARIARDLDKLAEAAMPREEQEERAKRWTDDDELPFMEERPPHAPFADVCFFVDGATFYCHKAFFCERSDFFRAIIDDHFEECDAIVKSPSENTSGVRIPRKSLNSWSEEIGTSPSAAWDGASMTPPSVDEVAAQVAGSASLPTPPSSLGNDAAFPLPASVTLLPLVRLDGVSRNVFEKIVRFVYTNTCQLDVDCVQDVLEAADLFLLPGLKSLCGVFIADCLEVDNVVQITRTARLFGLHRLEDACCAFIAKHLEQLVKGDDLKLIIAADAAEIQNRDQEKGDSIPIVDEIRYHISSNVQSWSDMEEAGEKLSLMDSLLDDLNLEGCCQKEMQEEENRNFEAGIQDTEWDMEFMMELPDSELD